MNKKCKKIHEQIFIGCSMGLAFFMPVFQRILPSIIFLMLLNWIIEGGITRIPAIFKEKNRILTFSFIAIYFLYLVGMLYSKNMKYGFFDLQVKLSLLLFPIIFATVDKDFPLQKLTTNVFKALVAGCLTGTLILLGIATISFINSQDIQVFFYITFSRFIHPSYLSMYLNLAVGILAYHLINKKQNLSSGTRILFLVLTLYFSFVIILLSSKAGIFSLLLLTLMITIYLLKVNQQIWKGLIFISLVIVAFHIGYNFLPNIAGRFKRAESAITDQKRTSQENMESNSERLVVWKAGLKVIEENPVFGVGTGDVKDALLSEYQKENKLFVYNLRLNAHNQYIQTYIALGIPGILLLALFLVIPGWLSLRNKQYLYFSFLAVFAFNVLVESMLEVQAGVIYYAFFNSLFFFALVTTKANPFSEINRAEDIKAIG
ncbi:MAG: O-antigen ligase family protein [Bacteroidales bacterium]|jgi:O-antigen ligase